MFNRWNIHVYNSFRNYLTVAHLIEPYPPSIEPQKSVYEIKHDVIVDTENTNGKIAESERPADTGGLECLL